MSQDIILEIDSINKRINEMCEDLIKPQQNSLSMQTLYREQDWDYGEDKNLYPIYILLAEEFENCARLHGIKVRYNKFNFYSPNEDFWQNNDDKQSCSCFMNLKGRGIIVIMLWTIAILLISYLYYQNSMSKSRIGSFIPIQNPNYKYWDNIKLKFEENQFGSVF